MSLIQAFIKFFLTRSPRNATALRREIKLALLVTK